MTEQQIVDLIAEYNVAEAEQNTRRRAIFEALQGRRNYRRIAFTATTWNTFDLHPSGVDNILDRHDQTIREWSLGEE